MIRKTQLFSFWHLTSYQSGAMKEINTYCLILLNIKSFVSVPITQVAITFSHILQNMQDNSVNDTTMRKPYHLSIQVNLVQM